MATQCPACAADNPDGKRFCGECGASLALQCGVCGAASDPGKRFCGDCGAPLSGGAPSATATAAGTPAGETTAPVAERRLTSVLFGDLVGFTTLAEGRDPEEMRELLSRYFATASTVVARYGGTVEKFIGDAVMAVWGVPVAHEDDAERAVRAGLDLVSAVNALGGDVGLDGLAMRVGVLTGEVAVTIGAVGEGMVAGDAVNTAARIQTAASPGEVWVDETTRSLTAAAVAYRDAGEHVMKGKAEPMRLHVATAVVASVRGVQRVDGLEAPFIGRDRELRLVKELFHATLDERRPRLVAVSGVAGVGKSRVGWEFEKYVDGLLEVVYWHRGRALSYGDGVTFWPFAEMVRYRLGIVDGDPPEDVEAKLDAGIEEFVEDASERTWLRPRLATLIGAGEARVEAPASTTREDLFSAWTAFLERVGGDGSGIVLVFDDMQYAEPGLLDFIDHLLEAARLPLFVLTLARPELVDDRPGWGAGRRATPIYLEALPDAAMEAILDGLVDGLPPASRSTLVSRAEGIPLYALETVRALIDRDAVVPRDGRYVLADDAADRVDLATLSAPPSLLALIAARLDALAPAERRVVQDATVLGLNFTRDGLAGVTDVDDLDAVLAELVRKEIVVVHLDRFSPERGQYRFVQALVRTVAYDTLSRRDRKARHLAVAAHLLATTGDELSAIIARHYLDAIDAGPADPDVGELTATAVALLERAAARAEALGSPDEAERQYRTALDRDPAPEVRARLLEGAARTLQTLARTDEALAASDEARAAYRALGLDVDAGRTAAITGRALVASGRIQQAIEVMAPEYHRLVDDPGASSAVLDLAEELARAHLFANEAAIGRPYADQALKLAEQAQDWGRVVALLSRQSTIWLSLGMPTGGMALLRAAIDLGRRHHLPNALIIPMTNLSTFLKNREIDPAVVAARESVALAEQAGARDLVIYTTANLSLCLWLAGAWDELEALEPSGVRTFDSAILATLRSQVRLQRGQEIIPLAPVDLDTVDDAGGLPWEAIAQAQRFLGPGDRDERVRLSTKAVEAALAVFGLDDDYPVIWPVAVDILLAAGDVEAAAALVKVLDERADEAMSPLLHAQLLRLRAAVAAATGATVGVDAELADAVEEWRSFGSPFYLAVSLYERGRFLVEHGDAAEAEALLDEARTIFEGLSAAPWVERVAAVVPQRVR